LSGAAEIFVLGLQIICFALTLVRPSPLEGCSPGATEPRTILTVSRAAGTAMPDAAYPA
jgi:hypothetical protein